MQSLEYCTNRHVRHTHTHTHANKDVNAAADVAVNVMHVCVRVCVCGAKVFSVCTNARAAPSPKKVAKPVLRIRNIILLIRRICLTS